MDIIPPDGALAEKMRDAVFIRTNPKVNVAYLTNLVSGAADKLHMIYDGYPLTQFKEAPAPMAPPFKILALGRFARFKGFDVLIRAASMLQDRGVDFHMTLAGSGARAPWFRYLAKRLGVCGRISFPGHIPYDHVSDLFYKADIFVMPSVIHSTGERDGIPNVIIEALLHRRPSGVHGCGRYWRSDQERKNRFSHPTEGSHSPCRRYY